MAPDTALDNMPVVADPRGFDARSGNAIERFVFNHRLWVLAACALLTLFLAPHAWKIPVNASFEKMIPQSHPYIRNYFEHRDSLRGMSNSVRIVLENPKGDIFDRDFLLALQKVNDDVFLIPGVDRSWMRSLWTPSLRWTEVTEEGYRGGPVMPDTWDGSPAAMKQLRTNIFAAGIVGNYVGDDLRSAMIVVPLLDKIQDTGQPIDYRAFSHALEAKARSHEGPALRVRMVGFAKVVGDLIDGLDQVLRYFGVSALIAAAFVFAYTRCVRSTLLLVVSALLGVVWMLGLLQLAGYVLDPYSILVPFLIFAIGLSHGAQKMNGIMQDIGRGTHRYVAARYTFRRLFMAGLTALLTNVVGFAVLMVIDIPVIQGLAIATSLGVCILIFTKLMLVPVALSYVGVSPRAAARSVRGQALDERAARGLWSWLGGFTERPMAGAAVIVACVLAVGGLAVRTQLRIGDLDAGAPELRPDSRYNLDSGYVTAHYGLSSDQFVLMLSTPPGGCREYATLVEADRIGASLGNAPGVQTVATPADGVRMFFAGQNEGNPKFFSLPRNPMNLNMGIETLLSYKPELADVRCAVTPIVAYLADHKADTLDGVVAASEALVHEHGAPGREVLLAAGSAGIAAVTNMVVKASNTRMLVILYATVALLCFATFRNWRAVIVAVVPLVLTSVMCEALMVVLGIGVKVATLPVIALGVGVGVDYALYLLSVQLSRQRRGEPLRVAYEHALQFTGKIVGLVGLTFAAGVVTWAWSPIKFQADMGILLTFMFLWNMAGALVLIPALSHYLLRTPAQARAWRSGDAPAQDDEVVWGAPGVGHASAAANDEVTHVSAAAP
jgi:predicted RND superfamily exporter protein